MKKIIIAPYAARLRSGKMNPKNYPVRWWEQVVASVNAMGADVIQIGVAGEDRIEGVSQFILNWPLEKLKDLARDCDMFISVDSFWPHFCHTYQLMSGVVIWAQSDPVIFGHPENINLLKDRKYLREFQFQDWTTNVECNEAAFVLPYEVINAVTDRLARIKPQDRRKFIPRVVQLAQSPEERPTFV